MTIGTAERRALEELDFRLNVILPEEYQGAYDQVQPVPMGSAGLKFDASGQVKWDEMWQTFCDLAMAGGPPHKGTLLEPGRPSQIDAAPDQYQRVAEEICRGIVLATELPATPAPAPGWVRVDCLSETMADWLLRAIVMENVAVRRDAGRALDLPASPAFRLEKEIKNVVTVIAKTCHYWTGHIPRDQKRAIADLFVTLAAKGAVLQPDYSEGSDPARSGETVTELASAIHRETGLEPSPRRYAGWLGLQCPSVRAAIWIMRALVASNVLARREETILFVPVNASLDPRGRIVSRAVLDVYRLAAAAGAL